MATITAFIRTSSKKAKKVNVRFRLRDGRAVQLLYSSDITVNPEHWNPAKEEIKAKVLMDPVERAEFNRNVARIKEIIIEIYNAVEDKSTVGSDWLTEKVGGGLAPYSSERGESKHFL